MFDKFGLVTSGVKKAVLHYFYQDLTGKGQKSMNLNCPVTAAERGRQVLVHSLTSFFVGDHNFSPEWLSFHLLAY